jgi:hypothetical protein
MGRAAQGPLFSPGIRAAALAAAVLTAAVLTACENPWMKEATAPLYKDKDNPPPPSPPPAFTLNSIGDVEAYLDETVTEPVFLPVSIYLGGSGWTELLDAIDGAGKTVNLDLSACTMSGPVFDPDYYYSTGKDKIVSLVLPNAAASIPYSIGDSTFIDFSALTSVKGERITSIGGFAFRGCTALTELSFPMVQTIGNLAFYGCTGLTAIDLPATEIGTSSFWGCTALETVKLPAAATIGEFAFRSCTDLRTVRLPAATAIGSFAFEDCTALNTVIIGSGCNINASSYLPNGFKGYYDSNSQAAGTYTWDGYVWSYAL